MRPPKSSELSIFMRAIGSASVAIPEVRTRRACLRTNPASRPGRTGRLPARTVHEIEHEGYRLIGRKLGGEACCARAPTTIGPGANAVLPTDRAGEDGGQPRKSRSSQERYAGRE